MIIFDNVSKTYPNGVKGLSHINLTINDGEFVSIIGLSGAGKSTLLRSVNRLNDVTEGEDYDRRRLTYEGREKRTAQDPPQNRHDLTAVQPG